MKWLKNNIIPLHTAVAIDCISASVLYFFLIVCAFVRSSQCSFSYIELFAYRNFKTRIESLKSFVSVGLPSLNPHKRDLVEIPGIFICNCWNITSDFRKINRLYLPSFKSSISFCIETNCIFLSLWKILGLKGLWNGLREWWCFFSTEQVNARISPSFEKTPVPWKPGKIHRGSNLRGKTYSAFRLTFEPYC